MYEALRFGTSLAQKAKRASGSESPHRNSVRKYSFIKLCRVFFYPVSTKYFVVLVKTQTKINSTVH